MESEVTPLTGKEKQYTEQLQDLGIYSPAFDGEIHQLCILERELSRARKAWKNSAPPNAAPKFTSDLYEVIMQIQREIFTRREALGLTPRGLKRIKGAINLDAPASSGATVLDLVYADYAQG